MTGLTGKVINWKILEKCKVCGQIRKLLGGTS
jgi:hypothetical protein